MPFDKKAVVEAVRTTLAETPLPGSPTSVESSGVVQRAIVQDGRVTLVLQLPPDLEGQKESLKRDLEERIGAIPGVDDVQFLEKSAPSAPGQEAAVPPGVPGVRHTIAVASGKGGVGKSTVAVNLAAQLVQNGFRVGLLDSDVYGPSIPKMLGLEGARPEVTEDQAILPLERHGISTMSIGFLLEEDSPVIWRGPMVTNLLRQFLFQVQWGDLDYLILDLPPGTGDAQLTLVQSIALSGGVIVTTPQDVALLDVQRGIQMFQRVNVPILGIVENMSVFICPHCQKETAIFSKGGGAEAARKYGVPLLGSIPLSPSTAQAGDEGVPSVLAEPGGALTLEIRRVADAVAERLPVS